MVQGRAFVTFTVECDRTNPGEAVFLIGDDEVLGQWIMTDALPMTTSAETFPWWSSAAILLPGGTATKFKFVIMKEDLSATVSWEDFVGDRVVEVAPGTIMTVRCKWSNVQSTSATASDSPQVNAVVAPAGLVEEGGLLKRSMSGINFVKAEMESLSGSMAAREPLRRNFSQSLLRLSSQPTGAPGDVNIFLCLVSNDGANEGDAIADQCPAPPVQGVPLQRITSFSALTDIAPPEAKEQVRRGKTKAQSQYDPYNLNVPVVIVSSEVAPYSKSGGLGLVASSYAYEFARNGHRTMAISPKYRHYEDISLVGEASVRVEGRNELVKYWHKYVDYGNGKGCDFVFVDHPSIDRPGGLYNGDDGREYGDNLLRFTLLSAAAMEAPLHLHLGGYPYGEKVLFLANDWQAGLVPLYLCYRYRNNGCYHQARCIYVIHNLGYQGQYGQIDACHFFGVEHKASQDLVFGSCINLTKGALICADRVLTVSPNYAREIQTREGGFGLEEFVRCKAHGLRLTGILNGVDDCWNPEIDTKIFRKFSFDDMEAGKRENKIALQRMLGLREEPMTAVVGFVGRLTWQKGVDVLGQVIPWLMEDTGNGVTGRVQLIMMGNGEESHANTLRWAEASFRGRCCGYVGFDPKVEHQMMAGCDLLLMPSRYEPCGLPQMCSQQYGCLPVVAATGGLLDSVRDVSEGLEVATGFHMSYLSPDKMKDVLYRALEMCIKRPLDFRRMQQNAMKSDFYWPKAVDQYEQNIDYTLYDPPLMR